jgi:hypothetical protein
MPTASRKRPMKAQPLPGAVFDTAILPSQREIDYEAVAETSWYTALMWAGDLAGDDLTLEHLAERQERCQAWLTTHAPDHPQWVDAMARKRAIENEQQAVQITRRCHAYACWMACCEIYAALAHLNVFERQSWVLEYAPDMGTDHPSAIWRHLRGDELAPGAWPSDKGEAMIEGRLAFSPVWDRNELRRMTASCGARSAGTGRGQAG